MKTNDGGMIWQQFTNSKYTFPSSAISGFFMKDGNLYASSVYGSGIDNIGVFSIDSDRNWNQETMQVGNIPVSLSREIDGTIYIGTYGLGIYTVEDDLVSRYESRFNTQNGLNLGKWYINSICEDPNNRNRIIAGTRGQGIIECINVSSNIEDMKWNFDINGIPSGNINKVKILPYNSSSILVGVENEGLYIKNISSGNYEKNTNGIPSVGNVKQIYIDEEVVNNFTTFTYPYESTSSVVVLRSTGNSPDQEPVSGTTYTTGYMIGNAEFIEEINGRLSVSDGIFKDVSNKIRSGYIYYYRFFEKE
jgi:hypothetical protein